MPLFKRIPDTATRNLLKQQGIKLISYIPKNAYWAKISKSAEKTGSVNSIDYQLWIPDIKYKMSQALEKREYPDHALTKNGIALSVSFVDATDRSYVESQLKHSIDILSIAWVDTNIAEVVVSDHYIDTLASLNFVQWVDFILSEPTAFSSQGLTKDGRIKSDVCVNGEKLLFTAIDSRLLYEQYEKTYNQLPNDVAITKGILLHTTQPYEGIEPDIRCGWGVVDTKVAVDYIISERLITDELSQDEPSHVYDINVPEDSNEIKVTLVWTDVAGLKGSAVNLVNDLDLLLIDPDGNEHYPWVLDSNTALALAGENHVDNVEQIYVSAPIPGTWTLKVTPYSIPMDSQQYVLLSDFDSLIPWCIKEQLGLPNDEVLTQLQLDSITELSCTNKGIKDTGYLTKLKNLQVLDLSNNNINNLDFLLELNNLIQLRIENNLLWDISALSGITQNMDLYLNGNCISAAPSLPTNINAFLDEQNCVEMTPVQFDFASKDGVKLNTAMISNEITVKGVDGGIDIPISIIDGEYSVNGNAYTIIPGSVKLHDVIKVKHISASEYRTYKTTTLTIGGMLGSFVSITGNKYSLSNLSVCLQPGTTQARRSYLTGMTQAQILNLTTLWCLYNTHKLTNVDIALLADLKKLTYLYINEAPNVTDISPLANLTKLKHLSLQSSIADISPLANLTRLKELLLYNSPNLTDISPLANLTTLEQLILGDNPNLKDISPLANLINLIFISLGGTDIDNSDLSVLTNLKKLVVVRLGDSTKITDLSPLAELPNLKSVGLNALKNLRNIDALANMSQLKQTRYVGTFYSEAIRDFRPHRQIWLRDTQVWDLRPLVNLPKELFIVLDTRESCVQDYSVLDSHTRFKHLYKNELSTFEERCDFLDSIPEDFSFDDVSDATISTEIISNPVTIQGLDIAPISIENGYYQVNGGAFVNKDGFVYADDVVRVQHTSSADEDTFSATTKLTIGNKSANFVSKTLSPDVKVTRGKNISAELLTKYLDNYETVTIRLYNGRWSKKIYLPANDITEGRQVIITRSAGWGTTLHFGDIQYSLPKGITTLTYTNGRWHGSWQLSSVNIPVVNGKNISAELLTQYFDNYETVKIRLYNGRWSKNIYLPANDITEGRQVIITRSAGWGTTLHFGDIQYRLPKGITTLTYTNGQWLRK